MIRADITPQRVTTNGASHALVHSAWRKAQRLGQPVLASITQAVPLTDPLAFFAAGGGQRSFWSCPSEGYELACLGGTWAATAGGTRRFASVRDQWQALCAEAVCSQQPAPMTGPLLFGGFAFDPANPRTSIWADFPDALLTLPRLMLTTIEGRSWLTINMLALPGMPQEPLPDTASLFARAAHPVAARPGAPAQAEDVLPPQQWEEAVQAAVARLDQEGMDKVVMARSSHIQRQHALDPVPALARLREGYPNCFVFAFDQGSSCFLGATPERLVGMRGDRVVATGLAGSIRRGINDEQDAELAAELLASAKDRHEHAIVVRALASGLADFCTQLDVPAAPTLLRLQNVQHLYTPISGRTRPGVSVLDLVARLHPTPAVGGEPSRQAMALIRELEGMDRGWYAAPVGWVDPHGSGEFAVALRSGLLHGGDALLFAGCGIVADSQAEQELAESRLKMRPMLAALGE